MSAKHPIVAVTGSSGAGTTTVMRSFDSHFGPGANLLDELAATFKTYATTGRCRVRKYLHDAAEAARRENGLGAAANPDTDDSSSQ